MPGPPSCTSLTSKWINVVTAPCTELLSGSVLFDELDDLIDIRLGEVVCLQELQRSLVRVVWRHSQHSRKLGIQMDECTCNVVRELQDNTVLNINVKHVVVLLPLVQLLAP